MFCDITTPDGQPAVADPRHVLKRSLAKAADAGFTFYTHPEIEFYLLKSSSFGAEGPEPVDSAGYFDNVPGGTAHDFRRRSVRMLEDLGHLGRVQPPRGRPRPERDRPALRRRPGDGRQHHDVPHRDQRGRDRAGRLRDVHAEAPQRQARQRHAHAHVAVRGRRQRVLRRGRAVPAVARSGRQFIAGLLRHAERDLGRDEPVRQLVQAPVGRRRGAELHLLGPQQPLRARARAAVQAEQGPVLARRVPRARLRREPLPRVRADARGRSQGHRGGVRAARPRPRTTCGR